VALDETGDAGVDAIPVAADPMCLVVGAEGSGVSRLVRERADHVVRIPTSGHISSLNASAAAAVALFEIRRQRA
ncbi:MAG: TrmH family RNA methyltransferase, partial [Candidatus Binatia bacterium]